uniref:Uncharacterized protein n=1 Tax=Podoviridae sp. ct8Lf7 TaxID=2827723 RepID=A0A8S5S142_9CAUD|nr:MAG TPA: hypothetical protein [Podoviridae sp. ct8Lf7]
MSPTSYRNRLIGNKRGNCTPPLLIFQYHFIIEDFIIPYNVFDSLSIAFSFLSIHSFICL